MMISKINSKYFWYGSRLSILDGKSYGAGSEWPTYLPASAKADRGALIACFFATLEHIQRKCAEDKKRATSSAQSLIYMVHLLQSQTRQRYSIRCLERQVYKC